MKDRSDRKGTDAVPPSRPPPAGTAGRSGSARSIGAELGGDLDFEPDALLDSLFEESSADPAEGGRPQKTPSADPAEGGRPQKTPSDEGKKPATPPSPEPPPIGGPPSQLGPKLLEPGERQFSPDDVTLVANIDMAGKMSPIIPIGELPPAPDKLSQPRPREADRKPETQDVSDVDALLAAASPAEKPPAAERPKPAVSLPRPAEAKPAPTRAPVPPRLSSAGSSLPAKTGSLPLPPSPAATASPQPSRTASVPRPFSRPLTTPQATAKPPAVNPAGLPARQPFPPAMSPAPAAMSPPDAEPRRDEKPETAVSAREASYSDEYDPFDEEVVASSLPPAPGEERPSFAEIAAAALLRESYASLDQSPGEGDEGLASLDESEFEEIGATTSLVTPEPAADGALPQFPRDSEGDVVDESEIEELRDSVESVAPPSAPQVSRPRRMEPTLREGDTAFDDERPAAAHLSELGARGDWIARAEWIQSEARSNKDPQTKARGLLVASELWAMAGDLARAAAVATEASSAAPSLPLLARQLRWLSASRGDWRTAASALDSEARAAPSAEARAHAALLGAEIARIVLGDEANAQRRFEFAARALPMDPRPHLAKLCQQLASNAGPPRARIPEGDALGDLRRAGEILSRLRGELSESPAPSPTVAFEEARRAIAQGDRATAGARVATLSNVEGAEHSARWLAAALLAPEADTRKTAILLLGELLEKADSRHGRRALAARALEQGDPQAVREAVSAGRVLEAGAQLPAHPFGAGDRVALAALTGDDAEAAGTALEELAGDPMLSPLLVAVKSLSQPLNAPLGPLAGDEPAKTEVRLGRTLAALRSEVSEESTHALRAAVDEFSLAHADHEVSRLLGLELALNTRAAPDVASRLADWPRAEDDRDAECDRHLAAGLIHEASHDGNGAQREYATALSADPACEAAARALLVSATPEGAAQVLAGLAEMCPDNGQAALLLTEAALRRGFDSPDRFFELVRRAIEAQPSLPFAYRLGEQLARMRSDAEQLLNWLRARRDVASDPIEGALDRVREALLIADTDMELAASLLDEALQARPNDVALRELYERLAQGAGEARAKWREDVAQTLAEPGKSRLLVQAALEYERSGDTESAARISMAISENDELARVIAERVAKGHAASQLAEALIERAKNETDPITLREMYERLSLLDSARGDSASALLWQSAIAEKSPDWLPTLRRLEHTYIGSGRDDELEPIAFALAKRLDPSEVSAHALIAARLRVRAGSWSAAREPIELAAEQDSAPLWALRALSAHARAENDDATTLRIEQRLSERATRAADAATLALRAGEAAARLGKLDEARKMLDRAVELCPEHLVALTTRAEILEAIGDLTAAAEALETVAQASAVDAHRFTAWHQAALLWIDKLQNPERGERALERALQIDFDHEDAIKRLQALYVAQGERAKLADLLERRLERTTDPEQRLLLEVSRGRALVEIGDRDAAKQALAAALDASPDHVEALDAFAELCVAEGDWSGAEQAWIRLARHATEPERQAEIYSRLAELYEDKLPNPQRAELSYKEVLKRRPDHVPTLEKLVLVYGKLGEIPRAIELQTDLVNRAASAEDKRDRTIQLARVYEVVASDRRKAEATLEKARKNWSQDSLVLRALADYYRRGNETTALNVLLDRSAAEARRALSTGRFDPSFFEILATVADVRGNKDAAVVAKATIAALHAKQEPLPGAGHVAADPRLDELLAPELLSLPLRTLLKKSGDVLDAAFPVDLRSLRGAPLPHESADFLASVRQVAAAFGIQGLELYVTPALGQVCLPLVSVPARIIFGQQLLESDDDPGRYFLLIRALKIIQGHGSALSRTAPIDLWPTMAAFLSIFAPNWQPQGVDAKKFSDAQQKIRAVMPQRLDDDVPVLALEVIGAIGNRASQLATAINEWGNRTGLVAVGDPTAVLRGVALAGGHSQGPPQEITERIKWIVRNPEARDVMVFSMSEQYAEARRRLGLS